MVMSCFGSVVVMGFLDCSTAYRGVPSFAKATVDKLPRTRGFFEACTEDSGCRVWECNVAGGMARAGFSAGHAPWFCLADGFRRSYCDFGECGPPMTCLGTRRPHHLLPLPGMSAVP